MPGTENEGDVNKELRMLFLALSSHVAPPSSKREHFDAPAPLCSWTRPSVLLMMWSRPFVCSTQDHPSTNVPCWAPFVGLQLVPRYQQTTFDIRHREPSDIRDAMLPTCSYGCSWRW